MELVRALVVDDEASIRFFLKEALQEAGYFVDTACSGEEALRRLQQESFELIMLDLMLGGRIDGQRVLEAARWRWPETVVVIVTGHGSLESAIDAIQEGVDGYLLKPVESEEVLQTVQEAFRRRKKLARAEEALDGVLVRGPFSLDRETQHLTLRGRPVELTLGEHRLLAYLLHNAEKVISAQELVQVVREYECLDPGEAQQIVKWYIYRLRRKVESDPSSPRHILNVRGRGYMFKA